MEVNVRSGSMYQMIDIVEVLNNFRLLILPVEIIKIVYFYDLQLPDLIELLGGKNDLIFLG